MRNLIIVISVVFIAIIAVSYFYFSDLEENDADTHPLVSASEELDTMPVEPPADNGTVWTFSLNSGAITAPSVHLDSDSTRFILIQDAYHILHAISADGQKLWNAQLPGPIIDSISQLPDHSLVFATAERLYRVDTEGDPLPGFSLKLPHRATQSVVATGQPADDERVRIEVTGSRQLMSYDGRGRLLRQQPRSSSDRANDEDRPADEVPSADLPNDCGPLVYTGPLYDDGQQYLLCGKSDGDLYCFSY
ncbi:MAG TPA: hypothetical protein VNQ55_09200 [Parapedobacter sp.]|nr:hypothetical protein [Parapedobacter sp.]